MAPRHILIGDVHGMLPELQALLQAVELGGDDVLVFVGDLLDKGPHSAGVVRFIRELRESGQPVRLVKGNHEDRHERFRRAMAKAPDKVQMKGMDELVAITAELSEADIRFLETAQLTVEVPGGVAVHAGVLPTMDSLDPDVLGKRAQMILRVRHVTARAVATLTLEVVLSEADPDGLDPSEFMRRADSVTEIKRRVRPAGSFIALGRETDEDPFWAEVYDGRFGTIYFGHSPFIEASAPVEFDHAVGLDLGAVFGNRLAAAIIEEDGQRRYVSVPASAKFCRSFWEE